MTPNPNRTFFLRSLGVPVLVLGLLLLAVLGAQALLSWRSLQRLEPLERHNAHVSQLRKLNARLQAELVGSLTDASGAAAALADLRHEIGALSAHNTHVVPATPARLRAARAALDDPALPPRVALGRALGYTRQALGSEADAHEAVIKSVRQTAALELRVALAAVVVFPLLAVALLYLLRRRVVSPLRQLSALMGLIARRDYSPAPVDGVDPLLLPLTESYNHMAGRLSLLEAERRQREHDLEAQVREAARALLAQSRRLAQADRLAAVGESMARVAHELRNPLAGVKLACANLEADLDDAGHRERIALIMRELDRVATVLDALLDEARHRPESARPVVLAECVAHLFQLLRYQLPARVELLSDVAPDLTCRLPEAMLQQALLNLILNASQALGESSGTIRVRAQSEAGRVVVSVEDDGPGFPDDLLAHGVRAFASRRLGGTGLGLAMTQRFARALDGDLKLASIAPRGARASLELPCHHA